MAVKNSLQNQQQAEVKNMIKRYEGEIAKALPRVMTPERFTRIATSAVSNNPKLAQCDGLSFISALMNAAQLGLEPNTPLGQAYLIPYGKQCQFQIGYRGMIDLARRSGEIQSIDAQVVYENDEFDYELGLNPNLVHKPAKSNRGKPAFYYAVFKLTNGGFGFDVMSYDDVLQHAKKYSKSFSNGPWQTNFDAMAKKTVLKRALKYAPLKSDFVMAMETDETVKHQISDDMRYVQPDSMDADFEEVADDVQEQPQFQDMPELL